MKEAGVVLGLRLLCCRPGSQGPRGAGSEPGTCWEGRGGRAVNVTGGWMPGGAELGAWSRGRVMGSETGQERAERGGRRQVTGGFGGHRADSGMYCDVKTTEDLEQTVTC